MDEVGPVRLVGAVAARAGRIDVIDPAFLLLLAAVAAAAWVAVRRLRRRGLAAVVGATAGALALSTLLTAALVNAHYEYLPRLQDALGIQVWPKAGLGVLDAETGGRHLDGAVVVLPIAGTSSGFGSRRALVYVPPQYFTEPAARFPVAYLLHGAPGAPVDWFRAGDAARAGLQLARDGRPTILVAPRLSRHWLDDSECVDRPTERVETYLTADVVPAVDGRLRTRPVAGDRLLVGLSAGGYCALNLGLRHRDEFGALADLSGLDRPTHTGGDRGLFGPRPDLASVVRAESPVAYVPTMAPWPREQIYLACGRTDHEPLRDTMIMDRELTARGEPVTLEVSRGSHDYAYWRHALPAALAWWQPA